MKYIYIYLLISLTILSLSCDKDEISSSQSESFIKYYGSRLNDFGNDVKQLPDGGYVIAGTLSVPDSGTNICLIFTDKYGNSSGKIKSYGGVYDDAVSKILLLPDGGVALIGSVQRSRTGNKDIFVMRTDASGDTLWTRKYGGNNNDEGNSLIIDDDGNLVLIGYSEKTGNAQDKDIWIYKIDLNGNGIWGNQRISPYAGDNSGTDIISTDNGYIVMGTTIGGFEAFVDTEVYSIFIYKTDKQAISPTSFIFISNSESYKGSMLKKLPDGNIMVLGTANNDMGKTDILLAKISSSFSVINGWPKFISSNASLSGNSLQIYDNKLHILGSDFMPSGTSSMVLYIADFDGKVLQNHRFSFLKELEGLGFDITTDGGYILTGGSTKNNNHESEIVLVKTKPGASF
jgi:hypothetical protein